jgi:glycosyltransferase involved in cell wall biosynthesis
VQLHGWKSQADVASILRSADVMVFPSIRELGAGVVVEAMACGCVPVVVNYGAPGELVTDDCGVRIPLGEKSQLIDGFRRALEALASDVEGRCKLGTAAHRRVEAHLTWPVKARKTLEAYEWAVGQRSVKPRFWEDLAPSTVSHLA